MVLGVGPDGHVASLFPHHPAAATTGTPAVAVHDSPKPPPDRVSLTEATVICPVRRRVTGAGFTLVVDPYPVSRTTAPTAGASRLP